METKRKDRKPTKNIELRSMSDKKDFTEPDIIDRREKIINKFVEFLQNENLLK